MSKRWVAMLAVMGMMLGLCVACGGDDDDENPLIARSFNGRIGGCQVTGNAENLRVGAMASTADNELREIASTAIDTSSPNFFLTLETLPASDVKWDLLGDGVTQRTEVLVYSYLDKDGNETYNEEADGNVNGASSTRFFFYDQDYAAHSAMYGYNVLMGAGSYSQSFTSLDVFLSAGGCDDTTTDGDTATTDGDL